MFRTTLDSEMKHLNSTGQYIHKRRAEPITVEDENLLWELGLLGTTSPTVLLHTLVYMVGLYFALRSGSEHRWLRYVPAQIQLIEKPHACPYLIYQEDISKTNQGGLHSRTKQPKEVIHYANTKNSEGILFISIRHTCQGVHQIGLLVHFIFSHCLNQKVIHGFQKCHVGIIHYRRLFLS